MHGSDEGILRQSWWEFKYEGRKRVYNAVILLLLNVGAWLYKQQTIPSEHVLLLAMHVSVISLLLAVPLEYVRYRLEIEKHAGLRSVYPIRPLHDATDPESLNRREHRRGVGAIVRIVRKASTVRLLLLSGYYYLGHDKRCGLLWKLLSQGRHVHVLLLNPFPELFRRPEDGAAVPRRWILARRHLQVEKTLDRLEAYRLGVLDTVQALKHLRRDGRPVSVGFYNVQPRWQLFLTDKKAAVQVVSLDYHAQYGPLFLFHDSPHSLYHHFVEAFEDMWSLWRDDYAAHRAFYAERRIWYL